MRRRLRTGEEESRGRRIGGRAARRAGVRALVEAADSPPFPLLSVLAHSPGDRCSSLPSFPFSFSARSGGGGSSSSLGRTPGKPAIPAGAARVVSLLRISPLCRPPFTPCHATPLRRISAARSPGTFNYL